MPSNKWPKKVAPQDFVTAMLWIPLRLPQFFFPTYIVPFSPLSPGSSFYALPTNVFDPPYAGTWEITLYGFDTTNGLEVDGVAVDFKGECCNGSTDIPGCTSL